MLDTKEDTQNYKPINVIAGAIVIDNGSFVIVQQGKGNAKGKWNIPAGRMDQSEDIFTATKREVKEEAGIDITLNGFLGVYQHTREKLNFIKLIFTATTKFNDLQFPSDEIMDAKWVTFDEFLALPLDVLRGKDLKDMVSDYQISGSYPLDTVKTLGFE